MNTKNTPRLETERLILRRFTEDDLEAIFSIFSDKEVNTYLPWYPVETMEQAQELYVRRYAQLYSQPKGYGYAVCMKADDRPVGYVEVSAGEGHDMGYGLRREFWRQGIATEAIRLAEGIVRAKPGYTALCLDVVPRNESALRLYHKLGFDSLSLLTLRKELGENKRDRRENLLGLTFRY